MLWVLNVWLTISIYSQTFTSSLICRSALVLSAFFTSGEGRGCTTGYLWLVFQSVEDIYINDVIINCCGGMNIHFLCCHSHTSA